MQLARDEPLIELMARAGCAQVFVGVESFSREALKAARKHQNDPARYADLIQLCHRHGIVTHYSNILGFPDQDEAGVRAHVRELRALRPFMASFYVLTPIPGTDQYDEFLAAGLIRETNLDRFDATCSVWEHPHFRQGRLEQLLAEAYREFYDARDVVAKLFDRRWNASWFAQAVGLGHAAFARSAASRGMHPMAGGFWRVRRDRAADYRSVRARVFGFDGLRLPASLALAHTSDRALYRDAAGV